MSRHSAFKLAVVLALVVSLALASATLAAKPGGEETAANNLSVPAIMIGTNTFGLTSQALLEPSGTPLTGFEVPGYYFVQGVHKWQAEWMKADSATGTAEWGDNLSGDAKLKVGSPIRVELGLHDATGRTGQGFTVIKLEPSKLDRESAYGTLATFDAATQAWAATTETMPMRIYDDSVTFGVKNVATGDYVVKPGTNPTGEINATGKVVYGYNLRMTAAGKYEITFVIPKVDITGVDAGTFVSDPTGPDTVTLVIDVIAGGGGGKK